MLSLDDVILKFQRGEKQLIQLQSEFKMIADKGQAKLDFQRDNQASGFEYTVFVADVPIYGKEIGLLLGEVIQSFRICLDYLAWSLVQECVETLTPNQGREVAFPMAENKKKFEEQCARKLPGV